MAVLIELQTAFVSIPVLKTLNVTIKLPANSPLSQFIKNL